MLTGGVLLAIVGLSIRVYEQSIPTVDCADSAMAVLVDQSVQTVHSAYTCMGPTSSASLNEQDFGQSFASDGITSYTRVATYHNQSDGTQIVDFIVTGKSGGTANYAIYLDKNGLISDIE